MTTAIPGPVPAGGSRAVPTVPAGPAGSGRHALFDVDPDLVAARTLSCPAVAGLSAGPFGAAATYLPGRRVAGVRLSPTAVEVHVVARYGPSVAEIASQVRAALTGQVGARQIDIVIEDLAEPAPAGAAGAPGAAGANRAAGAHVPAGHRSAAAPRLAGRADVASSVRVGAPAAGRAFSPAAPAPGGEPATFQPAGSPVVPAARRSIFTFRRRRPR